ncbi:MAG TPA: lanthionine synthetase LanC family protein, partial [Pirellulaceae bacterium]|nr:lanthionine synthetase LanC family protein [Pirellulaceae bacterium]
MRWPIVPDESERSVDHLYGGTAGIVLFYLELHAATGEDQFLEVARAGGKRLVRSVAELEPGSDLGLFTGAAGIGFVLNRLDALHPDETYRQAAHRMFEFLIAHSNIGDFEGRQVAAWNEVTDVIGGTAGIGMDLLDVFAKSGEAAPVLWGIAAGGGLFGGGE